SKVLLSYLTEHAWGLGERPDVLGALAKSLGLSLEPLTRLGAGQQLSREEMLAEGATEDDWHKQVSLNEATWQNPAAFLECLDALVQGLKGTPEVFAQMQAALKDESEEFEYFSEGTFLQDIEDLATMARWAQSSEAVRLRLVFG
ncbi:MAG TPA: hypothetical protein VNG33_16540, partial [Polyangiaceae bacterium]|nr:hypothetical protein [Polyangiaceae bacterium]